jgi:hypothetical protein
MIQAGRDDIQKRIVSALGNRSFNRIQMQIPFMESSIIFFTSNVLDHSSFWTNCIIELVSHDIQKFGGVHFYPSNKRTDELFNNGLVKLPKKLNFSGRLGRADLPTKCCLRIINGRTETTANELIDSFRQTTRGSMYSGHSFAQQFTQLQWFCPDVPRGGIVVWHGFHTTKGDKGSILPKATMFLDYTERSVLPPDLLTEYVDLVHRQPFDPGSGKVNTRGSRATIEFNAYNNISQAPNLPDTRICNGTQPDSSVGTIHVDRNRIMKRGYGVIVPLRHGSPVPDGCFPWFMNEQELSMYDFEREFCKFEFEQFLTYFVFEREFRYLTCWLAMYKPHASGGSSMFPEMWQAMKTSSLMFDFDTKTFVHKEFIRLVKQKNGKKPVQVEELQALYTRKRIKPFHGMTPDQIIQFHYNSWLALARHGRLLNINAREGDADFKYQSRCWFALFGGKYKDLKLGSTAAAELVFNDAFIMNWRIDMGSQQPKQGREAMCVGRNLEDVNAFIEGKVRDGMTAHPHGRNPQGGGRVVAGSMGMGSGTTYLHGDSHIRMQTGRFGATLAHAFYNDPLVVFERFRVKTHASWGDGHVDHDVQSRPRMITYENSLRF